MNVLRIAVALMRNEDGHVLLVRKRGTAAFMQPGGKIELGEEPISALVRELAEELDIELDPSALSYKGRAVAPAANEPGFLVEAEVFECRYGGAISAQAELAEAIWFDAGKLAHVDLAPLTKDHILPLAMQL